MSTGTARRSRCFVACLLLAGCGDPFLRPGSWDASQANQLNLAAQAADWRDLARGRGAPGSDGQQAAAAVERLRRGAVKPLPAATVSSIAAQGAEAPAAAPAAAAGN
jgi:hypothetical protein